MGNSYILKISSLLHTFSLTESGVDFSFQYKLIENDQISNILKELQKDDIIFCDINDSINSMFSIINVDNEKLVLRKNIEVSNGYRITDINMIKKLETEPVYKITEQFANEIQRNLYNFNPGNSSSTENPIDKPRNRIVFGAPGTGKSHRLEKELSNFPPITEAVQRDMKLEEIISGEIKNKPQSINNGDWAASIAIKYSLYFKKLEEWFNSEGREGGYNNFLNKTFHLLAKQPELMIAAYRGANLNKEINVAETYERVTFHPNYSYAQFVGTYKPIQDKNDENQIKYEYVPGPFMRVYVNAKKDPGHNYLLLIEEINRANVAAVFGDIFQLLDRFGSNGDKNGKNPYCSEYPVTVSEDLKKYLLKKGIDEDELSLPQNMYIWATMNSADQGVFPMDTAFKRRWEFEYIGIDENEDKVKGYEIPISTTKKVNWNEIRTAINSKLIELEVNEDKLLGPFFLNKNVLDNALKEPDSFIKLFESKVIMYLFEDAAKMKRRELFKPSSGKYIYSEICKDFENENIGLKVFELSKNVSVFGFELKTLEDKTE